MFDDQSNSPQITPPQPRRSFRKSLGRLGISLGLGLTAVTLGGLWYVRHFINTELAPQLQRELARQLQRPVNLGQVEQATFGSLRIGQSTIPATAQAQDNYQIDRFTVQLDYWRYVQVGKVGVSIEADGVQAFIPQAPEPIIPPIDRPPLTPPVLVVEPPALVDIRRLNIKNGSVTIKGGVDGKLLTIADIQGQADLNLTDITRQTLQLSTTGRLGDRGQLSISGNYILNKGSGNVRLQLGAIATQSLQSVLVGVPVLPQAGELNADLELILAENGVVQSVAGFAKLERVSLLTEGLAQPITGISGEVRVEGTTLRMPKLEVKVGAIAAEVRGVIGLAKGELDVQVATQPAEIQEIIDSTGIQANLTLPGALQLKAEVKGTVAQPQITGELTATQTLLIDRVALADFTGKFSSRPINNQANNQGLVINLDSLEGSLPGGGKLQGRGTVAADGWDVEIALEGVNGEAIAELYDTQLPIRVGQISGSVRATGALAQPEITAQISAPEAEYPAQITTTIVDNQALIRSARLEFPTLGGSADLKGSYNLSSGAWQAQIATTGLPLSLISAPETGTASLQADLRSDRGSFNPADISGTISANLPMGIKSFPEPISISGRWNGSTLDGTAQVGNLLSLQGTVAIALPTGITDVNVRAIARRIAVNRLAVFMPNLPTDARGLISFEGRLSGKPANLLIDGKLNLDQVNLADISQGMNFPFAPRRGLLSFAGRVNGNFPMPRLIGNWRISDLALQNVRTSLVEFRGTVAPFTTIPMADGVLGVENLSFNQISISDHLRGEVSYRGDRGLQVSLEDTRGGDDRLVIELDQQFLPIKISARLLDGAITAQSEADQPLALDIQELPLNLVSENLAGRLSSALKVDLQNNFQTSGDIRIDQPRIGRAILDRISAKVNYENNQLAITNGEVRFLDQQGSYSFQVSYNGNREQPLQGELQIENGKIQELTSALQWNEFSDIARGLALPRATAQALASLPPITGTGTLYNQIQYLAQLQARQESQEFASGINALFPPISEFRGGLQGRVALSFDRQFLPTIDFNISSQTIEYGKFSFPEFQTKGIYKGEVLTIERLRLGDKDSFAEISDALLIPSLFANGLSLDRLASLLTTEQRGQIKLVNFPIETLRPFPFYQLIPFDITGNMNGQASARGNLANLRADGKIAVNNPTINRQPLELVEGEFNFQNFRFDFNGKALVSGKEPLNAKGSLQVFGGLLDVQVDVKNEGLAFLNVLEQPVRWVSGQGVAALNIKGALDALQIAGKVQLDGARLSIFGFNEDLQSVKGELAFIGDRLESNLTAVFGAGNFTATGAIALNDPQLITANPLTITADRFSLNIRDLSSERASGTVIVKGTAFAPLLTGAVTLADGRLSLAEQISDQPPFNVGFSDLQVKLENMQITRIPVFSFVADGAIVVNGTAQEIRPSGRVNFSRGQFNAISARFRLDRSFDNFAEFIPSQGLDPNLNVRVAGSIAEVTRVPIITDPVLGPLSPRDVPVSAQGAQRTLRVQATVQGVASSPNISLTSAPPRNQGELVALIGGGVISQTGGVDAASAFVNFAGGGILNFLQDVLGDALSVAEFNLNPVSTNPRGTQSTTLGLAAEAAIDFSNSFSAAVRTIINDPSQPTDYSIRYRLDPTIIMRGNINSRGEQGVSIEFETRF